MKYKGFLDADFKLWFSSWCLFTLLSSMIYISVDENIGLMLLRLLGMLLIALLTAMAAFNSMDVNERKKKAREEYDALKYFLHCQIQRFNILDQIYSSIEAPGKYPSFSRGLAIPYLLIDFDTDPINFNNISYFSSCIKGPADTHNGIPSEYQCLNIAYLSAYELRYKSLLKLIERRNEIMKTQILPILNSNYKGGGTSEFPIEAFKKIMSFGEFSNILHLSENIMFGIQEALIDLEEIVCGISDKAKEIVSKEIALENGGYPKFILPKWRNNGDELIELSDQERQKFNADDYPISKNYVNYNSMKMSISWN